MAIVRWEPYRDLMSLHERMNTMFNEFFAGGSGDREEDAAEGTWSPAVDIHETEDDIILKCELPGMKQVDIQIEIRENVLTIKGERMQESEAEKDNYHRVERAFGAFHRSFTLPGAIKQEKVKATYKEGVLKVAMPKAEATKPKRIKIS